VRTHKELQWKFKIDFNSMRIEFREKRNAEVRDGSVPLCDWLIDWQRGTNDWKQMFHLFDVCVFEFFKRQSNFFLLQSYLLLFLQCKKRKLERIVKMQRRNEQIRAPVP
jgi:hypothetical protein